MAGKTPGRKTRAPIIDIDTVTGSTVEGLRSLLSELETPQLPRPLFLTLRALIVRLIAQWYQPWPRQDIEMLHWYYVGEGRHLGAKLGWDELQYACDVLKGTPAEALRDQMSKDFWALQKRLRDDVRLLRRKPNRKPEGDCSLGYDHMVRRARQWAFQNIPGWPVVENDDHDLPDWVKKG